MWADPEDLDPLDRALALLDEDFDILMKGDVRNMAWWVAEVEVEVTIVWGPSMRSGLRKSQHLMVTTLQAYSLHDHLCPLQLLRLASCVGVATASPPPPVSIIRDISILI